MLVRCLREANVAIFFGTSWSRQTSLSKGFSYYFHDSKFFKQCALPVDVMLYSTESKTSKMEALNATLA